VLAGLTDDTYRVDYEPAEKPHRPCFGGNSNWRWNRSGSPVNYLLIESIQEVPLLLRRRDSEGRVSKGNRATCLKLMGMCFGRTSRGRCVATVSCK